MDETRHLEDSPISEGPLCSPGPTDSDLGHAMAQGRRHSWRVSMWLLSHHSPGAIPVCNLDVDSFCVSPDFSTAPLPTLSPFSCVLHGDNCHFHQAIVMSHSCICGPLMRLSLLVHCHCIPLHTRFGAASPHPAAPMWQSLPPTVKLGMPNTLFPRLPCS